MMTGTMMHQPLTISSLIAHAARYHAGTEVVSVETTGGVTRSTWSGIEANARKLAAALERLGIRQGERCATIAWNNRRHLEVYYGVAGAGMVCHTVNPRLFPEQLIYIINHAEDQVLFLDRTFVPVAARLGAHLKTVKHVVCLGPRDAELAGMVEGLLFYDELLAAEADDYSWPDLDENMPSSMCYTSGTTGNPKGVQFSHRSTVLHTLGGNQPDGMALSARDTILAVVPMFHANAWGVPYVAASVGCKMVLPGPNLDGVSLVGLIDSEQVTMALGVPTIWMGLLAALETTGSRIESLKRTVVGGSALPTVMIPAFARYGVDLVHAWGMTETSPLGTLNQLLQKHDALSVAERAAIREGQGRPPFGVELRLVDETGALLPEDGKAQGDLQIRGHWIVESYFRADGSALTDDGWFDTGDVATIDRDGFMIIRDRSKDIIKSGGEWISTVELEDIAMSHHLVASAAAIAARHRKWGERPVLCVVRKPDSELAETDLLAFYDGKIAGWQVPDKVIFVDELPLGATGKVLKNKLRDQYAEVLLNDAG